MNKNLDNWLKSTLNRRIQKIIAAFKKFDLRNVSNEIFFECQKDIQWYLRRGGGNKKLLERVISKWTTLMAPITPHLAEELWNRKHDNLVSTEPYPEFNPGEISEKDEVGEYLLSKVTDDVNEILKVTKITPKKIHIYVSPVWKQEIFRKTVELAAENKLDVGLIMKDVMSDPDKKAIAKEVSQFVGKLVGEIKKLSEIDRNRYLIPFNGVKYLENAKDYLKNMFSCDIEIYNADDKDIHDPGNKVRFAVPLRPAIYIE